MKNIILSFDDAREDFYTRAYPLLKEKNLTATLNVTSAFVLNPEKFIQFRSGDNRAMTPENVVECQKNGIEIALHGSMHLNTKQDVLQNIDELKSMGVNVDNIGFASPCSHITFENKNADGIWDLIIKMGGYIRSGRQLRREGLFYTFCSVLDSIIHSKWLFIYLNKRNIIKDMKEPFFLSVAIYSYTTIAQIKSLIKSMPNNSSVILMFHSILKITDKGHGVDKWYWEENKFSNLLDFLNNEKSINVCSTKGLLSIKK